MTESEHVLIFRNFTREERDGMLTELRKHTSLTTVISRQFHLWSFSWRWTIEVTGLTNQQIETFMVSLLKLQSGELEL